MNIHHGIFEFMKLRNSVSDSKFWLV